MIVLDPFHVILHNENYSRDTLVHILRGMGICVLYQTLDLLYRWGENLPPFLLSRWRIEKKTDKELFPPKFARKMQTIKNLLLNNLLEDGSPYNFIEIRLSEENKFSWFRFSVNCHRDKNGQIIGFITTGIDISEIKCREQILLREINHRSKNLLAILQSIATLTSRYSNTTSEFLKTLHGRIQCLSLSQDLITDSNWKGVLFYDLVHTQICRYLENKICFSLSGENPCLSPSSTLHIGLALHELLTSSFFHGAFFKKVGEIKISCNFTTIEEKNLKDKAYCVPDLYISIEWVETFPIIIFNSQKKAQFCNVLLERIVPTAVNGQAKYEIRESMVYYSLHYPYRE